MKSYIISVVALVMLLPVFVNAAPYPDSLFAIPDSNRVTLWDMHARRNCASEYRMEITRDGQHLTWIQRDTGSYAYCYCTFDYYLTYGPLEAGEYTTDVFFTESGDTSLIPLGSINFSILAPVTDSATVFEPFSSKCGGLFVGMPDKYRSATSILGQNHPNPFREVTWIPITVSRSGPIAIEIYNSIGEKINDIHTFASPGSELAVYGIDNQGRKLPSGIYYYCSSSEGSKQYHRMIILE